VLLRPTLPALRDVVDFLWASGPRGDRSADTAGARGEFVLPDGRMHLAVRLGARPLRLLAVAGEGVDQTVADAVVAGPYTRAYCKDVSQPGPVVGAVLRAGAAQALFGVQPADVVNAHYPLAQFWSGDDARLRDQLNNEDDPLRRINCLQRMLQARLRRTSGPHPEVARALQDLRRGVPVAQSVAASGYSHRRFLDLFRQATGMSPKHYARLARFRFALRLASGDQPWTEVALAAGYSDQAHLVRDFREFSGLTPQAYRQAASSRRRHVPMPARG